MPSIAGTYYVDAQTGSDSWAGTSPTVDAGSGPWRSLVPLRSLELAAGDRIFLHCGSTWREPLILKGSGAIGNPVVVDAYGDCPTTRPSIRLASLLEQKLPAGDHKIPQDKIGGMIAIDGTLLPRARYPENSYFQLINESGGWTLPLTQIPASVSELVGADLIVRTNDYSLESRRLYGVSASGKPMIAQAYKTDFVAGASAFLEGKPWMFTKSSAWASEGQWLHLRTTHPISKLEISMPGSAVVLNGTRHVVLRNFDIALVENHGIEISNAANIRLEKLRISDVGLAFVMAKESHAIQIEGVFATNSQHDGFVVRSNGVQISENEISDVGVSRNLRKSTAAIEVGYSQQAVVTNNVIRNTGYSAIMFGKDALIERNLIVDSCVRLADCGAIYTSGARKNFGLYGAKISGNTISRVKGNIDGTQTKTSIAAGIYLDDESAGIRVENNIVHGARRGLFSKATHSHYTGNMFIGNDTAVVLTNTGARGEQRPDGNQFTANHIVSTGTTSPVLIVGNVVDLPLVQPERNTFWLSDARPIAEVWVAGKRSLVALQPSLAYVGALNPFGARGITKADIFINSGANSTTVACPFQAQECGKSLRLSDQKTIWPLTLPSKNAAIVVVPK